MKARRRHELKENVLAHELGQIKTFFDKYGNWILGGVTAVAVVLLVIWYSHTRSVRALAEEKARFDRLMRDNSMAEKDRLAGLDDLAHNAKNPVVAASAGVFLGDLYSDRHLTALNASDTLAANRARVNAEKYYNFVISDYGKRSLLVARAHFGLGAMAENDKRMDQARKHYEVIKRLVKPSLPVAMDAALRLGQLERWSATVRFATTTQATTASAPASGPASAPATATAPRIRTK